MEVMNLMRGAGTISRSLVGLERSSGILPPGLHRRPAVMTGRRRNLGWPRRHRRHNSALWSGAAMIVRRPRRAGAWYVNWPATVLDEMQERNRRC